MSLANLEIRRVMSLDALAILMSGIDLITDASFALSMLEHESDHDSATSVFFLALGALFVVVVIARLVIHNRRLRKLQACSDELLDPKGRAFLRTCHAHSLWVVLWYKLWLCDCPMTIQFWLLHHTFRPERLRWGAAACASALLGYWAACALCRGACGGLRTALMTELLFWGVLACALAIRRDPETAGEGERVLALSILLLFFAPLIALHRAYAMRAGELGRTRACASWPRVAMVFWPSPAAGRAQQVVVAPAAAVPIEAVASRAPITEELEVDGVPTTPLPAALVAQAVCLSG